MRATAEQDLPEATVPIAISPTTTGRVTPIPAATGIGNPSRWMLPAALVLILLMGGGILFLLLGGGDEDNPGTGTEIAAASETATVTETLVVVIDETDIPAETETVEGEIC